MAELSPPGATPELNPQDLETVRIEVDRAGGEEVIFNRFGLSVDDLAQRVTFGSYVDKPLWIALKASLVPIDERDPEKPICPLGDIAQAAYKEGQTAGVVESFQNLSKMDPRFKIVISERTVACAMLKKK